MKPPFSTSASDNGMAARSDPYTPSAKRESDAGPLTDPGAPQGADWAKQHVVQRLRDAGIPPSMPLAAALAKHSALDEVRQEMIRSAGSETAMVELFGDMLGTFVPEQLRSWPVWYIRLPESWAADVPWLLLEESLSTYIARADEDPWYIAQYIAIYADPLTGQEPFARRHIRVPEGAVRRSVDCWTTSQAVLVLLECAETLYCTAYPLDEVLVISLQVGDGASSRRATFDMTAAAIQGRVREREDMPAVPQTPDILTPSVLRLMTDEEQRAEEAQVADYQRLLDRLPSVSTAVVGAGAIGLLHTIVDYVPDELGANHELWLRMTVPSEMYSKLLDTAPTVHVQRLLATDRSPATIAVTVSAGEYLVAACASAKDCRLAMALDAFAATGRCSLALENARNGRLHVLTVQWPTDCHGVRGSAEHLAEISHDPVLTWVHPAIDEYARRLAARQKTRVLLHVCQIVDAATWQQIELGRKGHAKGPCGGIRSILGRSAAGGSLPRGAILPR